MSSKVEVEINKPEIKIDGKKYVLVRDTEKKAWFEAVEEKEVKRKREKVKSLISDAVDKDKLLSEVIKNLSINELDRIQKLIAEGAKVKAREGCFELLVDGGKWKKVTIPLIL